MLTIDEWQQKKNLSFFLATQASILERATERGGPFAEEGNKVEKKSEKISTTGEEATYLRQTEQSILYIIQCQSHTDP